MHVRPQSDNPVHWGLNLIEHGKQPSLLSVSLSKSCKEPMQLSFLSACHQQQPPDRRVSMQS
jgi:hypothetical protein